MQCRLSKRNLNTGFDNVGCEIVTVEIPFITEFELGVFQKPDSTGQSVRVPQHAAAEQVGAVFAQAIVSGLQAGNPAVQRIVVAEKVCGNLRVVSIPVADDELFGDVLTEF